VKLVPLREVRSYPWAYNEFIERQSVKNSETDQPKWWFNLKTHKVEFGLKSHALDRLGPFESEEEASRALEIVRQRSKSWATEEENEG
jgi:hypothetical protein